MMIQRGVRALRDKLISLALTLGASEACAICIGVFGRLLARDTLPDLPQVDQIAHNASIHFLDLMQTRQAPESSGLQSLLFGLVESTPTKEGPYKTEAASGAMPTTKVFTI
jgi:hypothetical protein